MATGNLDKFDFKKSWEIALRDLPQDLIKLKPPTRECLTPEDKIADLAMTMDDGKATRNVPIVMPDRPEELNQAHIGEFQGIITIVDLLRFLPPYDGFPTEYLEKKFNLNAIYQEIRSFNNENGSEKISDIFQEELQGLPTTLDEYSPLKDFFKKHLQIAEGKRKCRTLPVIKPAQKSSSHCIFGMWEYTDALELIKEKGGEIISGKFVSDVCYKGPFETLNENSTLAQVREKLIAPPYYTHIPIKTTDGSIVTGLVDEILFYTFQHPIFAQCWRDMPLKEIVKKVKKQDIVELNTPIYELIDKFVKKRTKPTAILVGKFEDGKFDMQGIVNYIDIFNKFIEWVEKEPEPLKS